LFWFNTRFLTKPLAKDLYRLYSRTGLHNTKLEGPNYQHKFASGRKRLFHFDVEISL